MNLTKTEIPFVCLGHGVSFKWLQIIWSSKTREEMDNFNIISYFSMALNAEFHVIHISFKTNTFLVE